MQTHTELTGLSTTDHTLKIHATHKSLLTIRVITESIINLMTKRQPPLPSGYIVVLQEQCPYPISCWN